MASSIDTSITMRLAVNIYLANMEILGRESVLFDMLPVGKQKWYVDQAARVLTYASAQEESVRRPSKFVRRPSRPRT